MVVYKKKEYEISPREERLHKLLAEQPEELHREIIAFLKMERRKERNCGGEERSFR